MSQNNHSGSRTMSMEAITGKLLPVSVAREEKFAGRDSLLETVRSFLDDCPELLENLEEIDNFENFSFERLKLIVEKIEEILKNRSL